jgi:hypothetical protein
VRELEVLAGLYAQLHDVDQMVTAALEPLQGRMQELEDEKLLLLGQLPEQRDSLVKAIGAQEVLLKPLLRSRGSGVYNAGKLRVSVGKPDRLRLVQLDRLAASDAEAEVLYSVLGPYGTNPEALLGAALLHWAEDRVGNGDLSQEVLDLAVVEKPASTPRVTFTFKP